MDDIDKIIINIITKEIYVPNDIENTIRNTLSSKNKKHNIIFKIITIISGIIMAIGTVTFASYYISKNVFNNREGIKTAIEQNYISNGTENYIESNNINVKINNSLLNDRNLDINLSVELKDKDLTKIDNIEFEKILIYDEENKVLYSNNENQLKQYILDNSLDIEIGKFNDKYFNSGTSQKIQNKQKNKVDLVYNIISDNVYPKSKEIKILAENLLLKNKDNIEILQGKWNISEKLPEIFQDRKVYIYHLENNNKEDKIEAELKVYNTESVINLNIKFSRQEYKRINEQLTELKQEYNKSKEYNNIQLLGEIESQIDTLNEKIYQPIKNIYIENENGEQYFITKSETEHGKLYYSNNEDMLYYNEIFDLTLYNSTDQIYIYFSYKDKDYKLKLTR